MGFSGPGGDSLLDSLGVARDRRGNIEHSANWETDVPGVFTAGDCARGQSLIVWAIAEGRAAAEPAQTLAARSSSSCPSSSSSSAIGAAICSPPATACGT